MYGIMELDREESGYRLGSNPAPGAKLGLLPQMCVSQ